MLFAYDMDDRRIKGFAIRNIRNVVITDRKFSPKWTIEFSGPLPKSRIVP